MPGDVSVTENAKGDWLFMGKEYGAYFNLAERIEDAFPETDSNICADLRLNDSRYTEMWQESIRLKECFPVITQIVEGDGENAVSLSAEEHKALVQYLDLRFEMEDMERKCIYFRGHTDCYAYLEQIEGLHIE